MFRPITLETLVLRYELKGKGRILPDIFSVVLGRCAQFHPHGVIFGGQIPKCARANFGIWPPNFFEDLNQKSAFHNNVCFLF